MSDPVLPLGGARFDGLVRVTEHGPQGMITLRGDLSSETLQKAATSIAGVAMPGLRGALCDGDRGLLWMSPDELMVLLPHAEAGQAVQTLTGALAGSHALVVDVSDARASFQLHGEGLREVIAKLAPVDMAPDAFEPGMIRRTRLAQVAAGFWLRDARTAQIFCFRSVAEYMFNLLKTAAAPGSKVGYF